MDEQEQYDNGIDRTSLIICAKDLLINGCGPNVVINRDNGSRDIMLAAHDLLLAAFQDATAEAPQEKPSDTP